MKEKEDEIKYMKKIKCPKCHSTYNDGNLKITKKDHITYQFGSFKITKIGKSKRSECGYLFSIYCKIISERR